MMFYFILLQFNADTVLLYLFPTLYPLSFRIPTISPILLMNSYNLLEDLRGYVKEETKGYGDGCTFLS